MIATQNDYAAGVAAKQEPAFAKQIRLVRCPVVMARTPLRGLRTRFARLVAAVG